MFDILTVAPGKKKKTQSGWTSFNAPCCIHNGHGPDKRMRGGVKIDGDNWSYHCFNCSFKCGFKLGRNISKNCRKFLSWSGMDDSDINKWNLYSMQNRDLIDLVKATKKLKEVKFKELPMPEGELLNAYNPKHEVYIDYLESRKIMYNNYPFLVTPDATGRNANRIIIPYTYENKIVGHTSRFLDNRTPKFINDQQPGYVFGTDLQRVDWDVCLVFEGIFDAISFNGCALTHNTISDAQATVLRKLNKQIIIVPDQDKTGLEICERALELGFNLSLPDWGDDIKDANDALKKYGKLPTLISILEVSTDNKIKIEIMRNRIAKKL